MANTLETVARAAYTVKRKTPKTRRCERCGAETRIRLEVFGVSRVAKPAVCEDCWQVTIKRLGLVHQGNGFWVVGNHQAREVQIG